MSSVCPAALKALVENANLTLVDVGSRGGMDKDFSEIGWALTAIGFEPDPDALRRLESVTETGWRRSTHLGYAVGAEDGSAVLHIPESGAGASLRPHDPRMVARFGYDNLHIDRQHIAVDTRTLDALRNSGALPRIDIIKVDIEGTELETLAAGRAALEECLCIKVEASFLEQRIGQALAWDMGKFLLDIGFEVMEIHDIHRWRRRPIPAHPYTAKFSQMPYSRGQISQCDLFALRRSDRCVDTDMRLRLVLISAALGYFDYALDLVREDPQLSDSARESHGIDMEGALVAWSAAFGRRAAMREIYSSIRRLIPLSKSLLGGISSPKPAVPF